MFQSSIIFRVGYPHLRIPQKYHIISIYILLVYIMVSFGNLNIGILVQFLEERRCINVLQCEMWHQNAWFYADFLTYKVITSGHFIQSPQ
jgi:hypothetical protein